MNYFENMYLSNINLTSDVTNCKEVVSKMNVKEEQEEFVEKNNNNSESGGM